MILFHEIDCFKGYNFSCKIYEKSNLIYAYGLITYIIKSIVICVFGMNEY